MPRCSSPSIVSGLDFVYQRHGLKFDRRPSVSSAHSVVVLEDDDEVEFVEEVINTQQEPVVSNNFNSEPRKTNGIHTQALSSPTTRATSSERINSMSSPENLVTNFMRINQIIEKSKQSAAATGERISNPTGSQPQRIEIPCRTREYEEERFNGNHRNPNVSTDAQVIQKNQDVSNINNLNPCTAEIALNQQDSWSSSHSNHSTPVVNLLKDPAPKQSSKRTRWNSPEIGINKKYRRDMDLNGIITPVDRNVNTPGGEKNFFVKSQGAQTEISPEYRRNEVDNSQKDARNNRRKQPEEQKNGEHCNRSSRQRGRHTTHSNEKYSSYRHNNNRHLNNNKFYEKGRNFHQNGGSRNRNSFDQNKKNDRSWRSNHQSERSSHNRWRNPNTYPPQPTMKTTRSTHPQTDASFNEFNNVSLPQIPSVTISYKPEVVTRGGSNWHEHTQRSESTYSAATNNAVMSQSSSPEKIKQAWDLITTCSLCKRQFGTRKEASNHLKNVHDMKLCCICFEPVSTKKCFHKQHFNELHTYGDFEERAACPICGSKYGYDGMYQHMSKMHLKSFEDEQKNGKESKSMQHTKERNSEDQNRRPSTSWNGDIQRRGYHPHGGMSLPMSSNQSFRNQPPSYKLQQKHFTKRNNMVQNNQVNGNKVTDKPKPTSKLSPVLPVQSDDVEQNLVHSPRTLVKAFKIPKKKP